MSFTISVYAPNVLLLIPDKYDEVELAKFQKFPERKWHNTRDGVRGWSVPVTDPNIEYLESNFVKGQDYTVTNQAKLLLNYKKLTVQVDEMKAQKRWEYLFEDKPPSFEYPHVLKPFDHQRVTVEAAYGSEYFGLLMEMGTGKTKCFIDECMIYGLNLKEGEILKIVVSCPKSLIYNWEREFHKNFPDLLNYKIECFNKGELKAIGQLTSLLQDSSNIKIIIISHDSVATNLKYLKLFKPTIFGIDESHYLKNPSTQRWKAAKGLSEDSAMRRILTGTPISNNIMDVWAQFEILSPGILGYSTYTAFKAAFAEVESWSGHDNVVGYQEDKMPILKENMAKCSFIVKKSQCLDLPEKMYDTVSVDMPETMRSIYDKFATEFAVTLENGSEVETEHVIVQMLKLSQICSGFVSAIKAVEEGRDMEDDSTPIRERVIEFIPGADIKMNEMLDQAEQVMREGKIIIWSRFKLCNEAIYRELTRRGYKGGKYDSTVNETNREYYKNAFGDKAKEGPTRGDDDFRFLVGSPRAGGVGLTLLGTVNVPCTNVFYYCQDFNYGARQQSEDRVHRIGLKHPVLYKDFTFSNSIEEYISQRLQKKGEISDMVKNVGAIKEVLLAGRRSA